MSTVVKDLGPVTAYADAVAAGYTGTKEEWQALMASYATVAEEAQEAREGAEAAQDAAEDARDAAISAKTGAESAVSGFNAVVTQATNQAVQTVRAEGTTQVGNVSSEGTTQVAAVQAKGTEVMQSIPADYTQLSSDVTQLKEDLTRIEDSVVDTDDLAGAYTGHGYIRSAGSIGGDSSKSIYKFNVEGLSGSLVKIKTEYDYVNPPMAGFYSRSYANFATSVSDSEIISVVPNTGEAVVEIPTGAKTLAVCVDNDSAGTYPTAGLLVYIDYPAMIEVAYSTNRLDTSAIVHGKYINTSGNVNESSTYCYTGKISVNTGDAVKIYNGYYTSTAPRYITAYSAEGTVLPTKGYAEGDPAYVVPEGVAYVIVSMYESRVTQTTRININGLYPFEPYWKKTLPVGVDENTKALQSISNAPLSTLPEYILNTLAYKPLGVLTKPYICLTSDDGNHELATYTIPMLIGKGVPCTMGLMSTSEVMGVTSEKATVIDAVTNHGFTVAQHGDYAWTKYGEKGLVDFFGDEQAVFENDGLQVTSGICPTHATDNTVKAVGGGRWGVVRTGYNVEGNVEYNKMNGARSNIYALTSQNITEYDLDYWKGQIDYAIAHNYLLIPFWHDNALTASQRTKMEAIIDYALAQNIEFITLDQVPMLL